MTIGAINFDTGKKSSGLSLFNNAQETPSRKKTFAENHQGATNVWSAYANAMEYCAISK